MTAPPATNGAVTKRNRFADGSADRLPLSDGDWVLVRRELTFGQQRRLAAAGLTGIDTAAATGERLRVDLAAFDIEKLVTWVMDWSFTDEDGTHLDVSRERIEALTPETAREITEALDAHIEAQDAKKGPAATGSPKPAATSSSASGSAGVGRS